MVSVIIPIYNAEKYLTDTITGLQSQSYEEFEVLLINDGSTDDSSKICKDIARIDERFRYVYQENQGVSAARNRGLANCRGAYVTFIDADDRIPSNYLEELYNALVSHDCSMSVCDVAVIQGNTETARFTLPPQELTQKDTLNYLLTRTCINSGPCAKMYKREILCDQEFPALKAYEDILFVVDAVCRCDRIATTNQTEYRYLQNPGSAMRSFVKKPTTDILFATKKLLDFIVTKTDLDPRCFYVTASHLMQYVLTLVCINTAEARSFISEARRIYVENKWHILNCPAFPWKEKITYLMFTCGWLYHNKKFIRI